VGPEGIEAIVFWTIGDQVSLRESLPPEEVLRLPGVGAMDVLPDDAAFFTPFAPHFDARVRPSVHADGVLSAADVLEVPLPAGLCKDYPLLGFSASSQAPRR
jgi:transposase, IS5 family